MSDSQKSTGQPMRVTHDPKHGLAYVYLSGPIQPGGSARTMRCGPDIILDFDHEGRLIGLEVINADLIHPNMVADAVAPGTEWPE